MEFVLTFIFIFVVGYIVGEKSGKKILDEYEALEKEILEICDNNPDNQTLIQLHSEKAAAKRAYDAHMYKCIGFPCILGFIIVLSGNAFWQ